MHKIPQKVAQAPAKESSNIVINNLMPSQKGTGQVSQATETLFNGTANSNLSNLLQGITSNKNLTAPAKQTQKENQNENLLQANTLLLSQLFDNLGAITQTTQAGTNLLQDFQCIKAERKASESLLQSANYHSQNSKVQTAIQNYGISPIGKKKNPKSGSSKNVMLRDEHEQQHAFMQQEETRLQSHPTKLYHANQFETAVNQRINKAKKYSQLRSNGLISKVPQTLQEKSGSPGQKSNANQWQQLNDGGLNFDYLVSSNQSSAINSKQGTQLINKKVLQSANQIINELYAQEQMIRNNICGKSKKMCEKNASIAKPSSLINQNRPSSNISGQALLTQTNIPTDSLQPTSLPTSQNIQPTESSENNTQVTVIQVVEDVYGNEYLNQNASSNTSAKDQKGRNIAQELKKKVTIGKRNESKQSNLNRSGNYTTQIAGTRGNSGQRGISGLRQTQNLQNSSSSKASKLSKSNISNVRRSKGRIDFKDQEGDHDQDLLRQPTQSSQQPNWLQMQKQSSRQELNQSQVVKVKSPLIKEGESVSEIEERHRLFATQQRQNIQVQEFDDQEEEDDDYQFSSQVKKSNNTVLNSDESEKYKNRGSGKFNNQGNVVNQIQKFELSGFDNSNEDYQSSKLPQHNFYMTQVIKQAASKKNINPSGQAAYDQFANPLNITQGSSKSNFKLPSNVTSNQTKTASLRSSNLKISKSQLKSYNNRKPGLNQQTLNQGTISSSLNYHPMNRPSYVQNIGASYAQDSLSKSGQNTRKSQPSPLNNRLRDQQMVLEKYLAQNNIIDMPGHQNYGMSNYQKHVYNSNVKQSQTKSSQKKRSALNSSTLLTKTPNICHKTFDQTQPLPQQKFQNQQKLVYSQNNNRNSSKVNQSGFSDYLNSTAPLNLTQLNQNNQNEESFYYGLFNSGAGAGLSDVVNSTHNLRRISSKESWKNNTQGIPDQSLYQTQELQEYNQLGHENMSSYLYYSGNQGKGGNINSRIASNSAEKTAINQLQRANKVIGGHQGIKPQGIAFQRPQNLVSPPKDLEKKQNLIKNILMQDSLNQQKNKKYFLNLTLQQLIQQQKKESDMPRDLYLTDQSQQQQSSKQAFKYQKRLNKTLDNRRPDNMNSNSQQRIHFDYNAQDQIFENADNQDQTQDLRQFINNFMSNQSNGIQDSQAIDGIRKSRQQTKSFSSSVNKFSNTMKVSDFNNTQQIFDNQSFNLRQKSKSSLKSTQNINLKEERTKESMVNANNQAQLYSALSNYGGNQKPTTLTSQQKQRKIVKPGAVHIEKQINSNSQSRLSQNLAKHQKKDSQDERLLQQMLNIYEDLDPLSQKQLQLSGFDLNQIIGQPQKPVSKGEYQGQTVFNAYSQQTQAQSKYKTNQTLTNYLNNNSQSNKSLGKTQQMIKTGSNITSQKGKGGKQSMSNSFIKQVRIDDPLNSNQGTGLIRFNGEFSQTNVDNNIQLKNNEVGFKGSKSALQNKFKKAQLDAYQRQIQKELAKSALIQDLSSFGISIPASNLNIQQKKQSNGEFQSLSKVKKYEQKAANLSNLQPQINFPAEVNQNMQSSSNYQNNPYNFANQIKPSKPQSSQPIPAKKQSVSQLKIQKEDARETQNRTQPIPKHILEMALAASAAEGSVCSGSNNGAMNKKQKGVNAGAETYSSGNSIIINKQHQSKESRASKKTQKSLNKSGVEQNKQRQNLQQNKRGKLQALEEQQANIERKKAAYQNRLQLKEDDPQLIYSNKNAVILEEIQGRYQDSLESQSKRDGIEDEDDLLQDSSFQDSFSKLDRFVLGKQVGQGAYAVVRVATHKKTGKKYAIKVYDKSKLTDTNRQRSVRREIKLLQKMSHQNIVKIYEAFETDDHVYLVMEYVAGENLYGYLKQHKHSRLDEKEAKRIFKQLLTALAYCHRKSIAHRDIKLENILLDESNNVKLIDFGFSTCIPNDKKIKMFCGTPSYMAPEIVNKEEYAGPPADIWASGVLLYALMNGKFPFRGDTDRDLYRRINRGTFEVCNPLISPYLLRFFTRMINTNADDRPSAEELLQDRWFQVNDEEDTDQESSALAEERERLRQEYITEQKKQFKAKILSKGISEKQRSNIQLINQNNDNNEAKMQSQLHNIDLGSTGRISINPNNIMPGLRQGLVNQGYPNLLSNNLQQEPQQDYGNMHQINLKRLNQEAYQAYYNTSGNNTSNWGSSNANAQNPYYNNFFIQGQNSNSIPLVANIQHPGFLSNLGASQSTGLNRLIQNRGSPSKMHINTNHQSFPINFNQQNHNPHAQQIPNQIGTPQVFTSPTGFTCQANMINNNFNIINNITQVTCLPPAQVAENVSATQNAQQRFTESSNQNQLFNNNKEAMTSENDVQQKRSDTVIQIRKEVRNANAQNQSSKEEDIDEEIVESLIKLGGYHRSHVVSQIDMETSEIANLYNQMKEEKLSKTQNRPLSLQPYNRRAKHGFLEQNYMSGQDVQETLSGDCMGFSPHQAYSYLNNHTFGKGTSQNVFQRENPHNNKIYPLLNLLPSMSDSDKNPENHYGGLFQNLNKRIEERGGKILLEDQREQHHQSDDDDENEIDEDRIEAKSDDIRNLNGENSNCSQINNDQIHDIQVEIQTGSI